MYTRGILNRTTWCVALNRFKPEDNEFILDLFNAFMRIIMRKGGEGGSCKVSKVNVATRIGKTTKKERERKLLGWSRKLRKLRTFSMNPFLQNGEPIIIMREGGKAVTRREKTKLLGPLYKHDSGEWLPVVTRCSISALPVT